MGNNVRIHFSVDDFIEPFMALAEKEYRSVFEVEAFAFMKRMHDTYGMIFSCYCFFEGKNGTLADVPESFQEEFQKNSDWLRFGFHAMNSESNYGSDFIKTGDVITDAAVAREQYHSVIRELVRITGGKECIDRFPRIHFYAGSSEICEAWKNTEYGIKGLISSEDDRTCYYNTPAQCQQLNTTGFCLDKEQNIPFWKTFLRFESMKNEESLKAHLEKSDVYKECLVFTHAPFLTVKDIQNYFVICAEYAKSRGYKMGYFYENNLDDDWSEMLSLAKSFLNSHNETDKKYHQALILHTADGEKIELSVAADSVDELKGQECEKITLLLEKHTNPAVSKMICVWQNGEIDAPAFDVMKTLCRTNEENKKASVLLRTGANTFSKKSIKDIIG
ncbi:MAG: hypothetical protein KBS52_04840 [Clostridiales bacterium]|nr:hypothetical protein [Candidatus Equinaster intestinalis]